MYSGLSVSVVSNHALLQNYRHAVVYEGVNLIQFFIKKTVHWKTGMTEVLLWSYSLLDSISNFKNRCSPTVSHVSRVLSRSLAFHSVSTERAFRPCGLGGCSFKVQVPNSVIPRYMIYEIFLSTPCSWNIAYWFGLDQARLESDWLTKRQ